MAKIFLKNKNHGIATLPTVIVLGMMALAIAVSVTAVALNELLISQGSAQSSSALFYAEGGVRDALVRIARNKNYTTVGLSGACGTDCYFVDFVANGCSTINRGDGCAIVSVSSDSGTDTNPKRIISKGIKQTNSRKIQVDVVLDGGTAQSGEITSTIWTELTN